MDLVLIGYWCSDRTPHWPDPASFVDLSWDPIEREAVTDYLRRGFVARAYMGHSRCRFCDEPVGSLELSDGTFIWPEGLAHYVDQHGVRLPASFVEHVAGWTEGLEESEVDAAWWRGQAGLGDSSAVEA
jgi:hypothetical protein